MSLTPEEEWLILKARCQMMLESLIYHIRVPQKKHDAAVESANKFAGDFISYLDDISPFGLDKLRLSELDHCVTRKMISVAKEGELRHLRPICTYDISPKINVKYLYVVPEIAIFTNIGWNLSENSPILFQYRGVAASSRSQLSQLSFFFSPTLLDAESLPKIFSSSKLKNSTFEYYDHRFVQHKDFPSESLTETMVYQLLGTIHPESLGRELYVYGNNAGQDKSKPLEDKVMERILSYS